MGDMPFLSLILYGVKNGYYGEKEGLDISSRQYRLPFYGAIKRTLYALPPPIYPTQPLVHFFTSPCHLRPW